MYQINGNMNNVDKSRLQTWI